jgi:hypothetical protein
MTTSATRSENDRRPDGRRTGDDKVVLAAESSGGKRTAHHLERPFDTLPGRRGGEFAL